MLPSRVFLTLASTGLLLLVPGVVAGVSDHVEPVAGDVLATVPDAPELPPVGDPSPPDAQEARREGSRIMRGAWDEVEDAVGALELETLLAGAQQAVHDNVGDDPLSLIPTDIIGGEPEPEADPVETQTYTSGDASWDVPTAPLIVLASTAAAAGMFFWIAGSSGTLGAAGVGGSTAAGANRRFLPFASPLFTRFEKDTVLDHPKRESLYGIIVMKPGATLQDLCDGTGLSRTAVSHHLRLLEQQHLIVSKRVGRSRHFFENGGRYGRDQKDAYAVLHNDRSKHVHGFIEQHPGAIQKDLCEALGIQASVAHWHVKRLVEANLIEAVRQGRTVSYFPTQSVRGVVMAQ